jgi:hypothetical protein
MRKGKKVASLAFTGAAAAAAMGMHATHALAASDTWHVQAPKGTAYNGAFAGKANSKGTSLVDTSAPEFPLKCTSATAAGTLDSTATGATAQIGTINSGNFTACKFDGITFTAKLTSKANLVASGYNGTVTTGKITDVHAALTGNSGKCTATVTGSVSASYINSTHQLVVGAHSKATLTIHNPTSGCLVLDNSDPAYFKGTFTQTTPNVSKSPVFISETT